MANVITFNKRSRQTLIALFGYSNHSANVIWLMLAQSDYKQYYQDGFHEWKEGGLIVGHLGFFVSCFLLVLQPTD